ncbi:hypothetical protein [Delftia acidovorans]|uniref:DUF2778 domain-containing protein n=1 Tax=Delftia acidovorans TaxID=80866 RepID=A0AAJ2R653_DELAC|nr:hypothetical protein [Delftia acidovorans]MDX4956424.1 hypothetical protein [Delftia acidovorans]
MAFTIGKFFYVNKVPASGWLSVALKSSGTWVPLLEYTKLQITEISHNRVYFQILDGGQKNKIASLGENNAKEYLGSNAPKQAGAQVIVKYGAIDDLYSRARGEKYKQQTGTLIVDGISALVTLNTDLGAVTIEGGFTPIRPGIYKILVPPNPHDKNMTEFYRAQVEPSLRSDQVWFPIEFGDNSRFIHLGNISEGCVTVMDFNKWNAIYKALISHRTPDGRYVGKLTVQK